MTLSIFCLVCTTLFFLALGAFVSFVVFKSSKTDSQTDSIPKPKHHWSLGIYMEDIPHNEQNTAYLGSVPLKIVYERSEYSDLIVPRVGEEVGGVYYGGTDKFEMEGTVTRVFYNVDIDWIVVHCKCTDIRKVMEE